MDTKRERKYQMRRVRDPYGRQYWLLPGNDGRTFYRLTRYREDGSLQEHDGTPIVGAFWSVKRYNGLSSRLLDSLDSDSPYFGDGWEGLCYLLGSRAEAIEEALKDNERMSR